MPAPSTSLATLRPDLGGSVEGFDLAMSRNGFIGLKVLPVFDTALRAGSIGIIPTAQMLKQAGSPRAPGAGYQRDDFTFTDISYSTTEKGRESPVDDNTKNVYGNVINAEKIAAARAQDMTLRYMEQLIAAAVFNSSTFTPTAVGTEWSTVASSTPVTDVKNAQVRMWEATGMKPNAVIMNWLVFNNLRFNTEIKDAIKNVLGVLPSQITVDTLKAAFMVDHVLISDAPKNTAPDGQLTIAPIWSSEYVGVARIADDNDITRPVLGRTMHYTGDGSAIEGRMEVYRDENRRADIVRCRMQADPLIIYSGAMQLLSNITA